MEIEIAGISSQDLLSELKLCGHWLRGVEATKAKTWGDHASQKSESFWISNLAKQLTLKPWSLKAAILKEIFGMATHGIS